MCPVAFLLQAVEAAQLAEDLKVQLEHTQAKLKEIQVSVAENRTARERESSNLKRAQVRPKFPDSAVNSAKWLLGMRLGEAVGGPRVKQNASPGAF